jgi:tetratricopeptide (TPR) repeat protein
VRHGLLFALCAVMFAAGSASGDGGGTADKVKLRAQLGIIYAQNAQYDEARKEFVTLLEEPTGRAAALTNIGNLAVLEGKVDVGLENYTQAVALDTLDAGILLDLGLALKMAGRDEEAMNAFSKALKKSGGEDQAAYLLGVKTDSDTSKGKVTKLSNEEIKAMLAKARTRVPEATNASTSKDTGKTQIVSRPGGSRAADMGVGPTSFYWKEK